MAKIQVFLDTDVIISAHLSTAGASYQLIMSSQIKKIISFAVNKEINNVIKRQAITKDLKITSQLKQISINLTKKDLLTKYSQYTLDEKDTHVVAGADKSRSKFLLTHNTKHYKKDKIKKKLNITVFKPGEFLQYLRSKN